MEVYCILAGLAGLAGSAQLLAIERDRRTAILPSRKNCDFRIFRFVIKYLLGPIYAIAEVQQINSRLEERTDELKAGIVNK